MKDQEIIEKIRKGDESALDYLYQKHYRMMMKLILKNNGSEDEAKDIYQDALIVLWQKAMKPDFVLTAKISTFLYSICMNLWRKELERKGRHSNEESNEVDFINIEQKEKVEIINKCISDLGETCKKILTYYYFDQMSMNDIAQILGFANADTAKTKKYKCKKELDNRVKTLFTASDFLD
ncbi:MAG: RNA polymerase sigma factor [Cytophagaceae bacterium]